MARKSKESIVYGVGINDADYQVSKGSWRCPFYKHWKNMLARCYSPAFQRNQPLYVGCTVDPRWHRFSHFRSWMETQDWEGKQLDKDRKVLGNKVYGPDTCLWLTRKENLQARPVTVYVVYKGFWVNLNDYCQGDSGLYSYVYNKLDITNDLDEILAMREAYHAGVLVEWEGEEVPLKALCDSFGKDYETVFSRYRSWLNTTIYAAMYYDSNPSYSFELTGIGGVVYQFKNKQELVNYVGCVSQRVDDYLDQCEGSLVRLVELIDKHTYKDTRVIYYIDGVGKYRKEWIVHYETSEQRVSENMKKYSLPFEDAVQLPVERVRRLRVDGELIRVRELWERYGLDPKYTNNIKSQKKLTYKQTLAHFGAQFDEDIEIIPL